MYYSSFSNVSRHQARHHTQGTAEGRCQSVKCVHGRVDRVVGCEWVETKLDCRPRFGAPEQCEAHTFVFFLDGVVYGRPQPRRAH